MKEEDKGLAVTDEEGQKSKICCSCLCGPVYWLRMLAREIHWTFVFGVVVVYGISQGFGGGLSRLATEYYMKDVQKVQPSESQVYSGIVYIPWIVKPFWGLLTDVVPIFGYHRRPYFIFAGSSSTAIKRFIQQLHSRFVLKDLGPVSHFLGMEVSRDQTGIFLSQTYYAQQLLQRLHFDNVKECPTPMVTGKQLTPTDGTAMADPHLYRSAIGGLQYLTFTRPDITFAVNYLSQFMQAPSDVHWHFLKRLLRYVKGTLQYALHFKPGAALDLAGFSDADWAVSSYDRRSIAGHCVFLGESLISWSSKKQNVVSRSSCESEYRSLANLAAEMQWIQHLLKEIGLSLVKTPIAWCDNTSATSLALNPVYHARTKHIEIDIHYVRDQVLAKQLRVQYIPSADQIADALTKPLSTAALQLFRTKLNVVPTPSSLRGAVRIIG